MSDENLPVPSEGGSNWLENLNVPQVLLGPAGKALSRLLAGATDIGTAYLERYSKSVRTGTNNRVLVNSSVAKAAAKTAAKDPEIVQRAVTSLLAKEFRKQENKEAIAQKTAEILKDDPPTEAPKEEIGEDWMNSFERYAEEASTEKMQETWARVLAGEIRKPKTFSRQTLRFIAELDEELANLFEKHIPEVFNGNSIPYPPKEGDLFRDLLVLEEVGLISGATGTLNLTYEKDSGPLVLATKYRRIMVLTLAPVKIDIPICRLTRVGREIYQLSQAKDHLGGQNRFAEKYPKANVDAILSLPLDVEPSEKNPPIPLWVAPPKNPQS